MDNFEQIRKLLRFYNRGDFYFIQLFKRRKDNPGLSVHEKLIKSYSVFNLEEYDKLIDPIKKSCIDNNARAYIRLNLRNSDDVAFNIIKEISDSLLSKQTNSLHRLYDSVVGKYHSDGFKKWLVDIDSLDYKYVQEIAEFIYDITEYEWPHAIIKTINGYHLITRPFNMKVFSEKYSDITVHKDNPTLLYYEPKRIEEGREEIF